MPSTTTEAEKNLEEVKENEAVFSICGNDDGLGHIDICSPCGGKPLRYFFVREEVKDGTLCGNVADLLQASLAGYGAAAEALEPLLDPTRKTKTIVAAKELNERYTDIVKEHIQRKPEDSVELGKISPDALNTILALVYNRSIEKVEALNKYTPFSPEVYGETTFEFGLKFIEELGITENDTFLDLGSGVGNVVIQVAALCLCKKLIGIEIVDARAKFAQKMEKEFRSLMDWLGKRYGTYELFHGDFLDKKDLILQSSIIFCNNYAFTPELNLQLKQVFSDLPDKVRILVSKSLTDEKFRIYDQKTASDPSAVLPVRRTMPGKVSWTDSDVVFYLHEVDRTTLEKYFKSRGNPELRAMFEAEQRLGRPNYYESGSEQDSRLGRDGTDQDLTEDDEIMPRRRILTRSQGRSMGGGNGRRARSRKDSHDSELSDNERSPSVISDHQSEASSERTRSIPSQDSTPKLGQGVKRKRGRPPKSSPRVVHSTPGSSTRALQVLHKETVKSIKDVDRSTQPGCAPDSIHTGDELPAPLRNCLKDMENAFWIYLGHVRKPDFPDLIAERAKKDSVQLKLLKHTRQTLENDVTILRRHCFTLIKSLFNQSGVSLPKSASEFRENSRDMLKTIPTLRNRHNVLKDDIGWLKSAHKASDPMVNGTVSLTSFERNGPKAPLVNHFLGGERGFPGPEQKVSTMPPPPVSSSFFVPAGTVPVAVHRSESGTSGARVKHESHRDQKHGQYPLPDVVDLSSQTKKETKETSAQQKNAPYHPSERYHPSQNKSHSVQYHAPKPPASCESSLRGNLLERVISDSLNGPTTAPHRSNGPTQPVGNLRGISPAVPVEKEKRKISSPTVSHAHTKVSSASKPTSIVQVSSGVASHASDKAQNFSVPMYSPMTYESQQLANMFGGQAAAYQGVPYYVHQNASGSRSTIPQYYPIPGGYFDPTMMGASLAFAAVPGAGSRREEASSTVRSYETISPSPQIS